MTLQERLVEYVSACFTGLWIESHEHDEALRELAEVCRQQNWRLATWDVDRGLRVSGQTDDQADAAAGDPLAAIRALSALAASDGTALLVLANFHRFLQSPEIVQALAHQIVRGKQDRAFVVVLAPVVEIPVELEKLFVIVEHDLPGRQQLEEIAKGIATEEGELPAGDGLARVLDAAAGLTRYEAEGAFSLSLVRHERLEPEAIWHLKTGLLKKSGLLSLYRGGETFADLGGLESLKGFCRRAMRTRSGSDQVRPRGVLLLGVPGTGKSAFAKALGNELGRPTLVLDIGSLMGSLVGQTEEQTRRALRIADRMAPCILFVDELEKALSGGTSAAAGDSGVASRLLGTLLSWLSDHQSDVFFIGTCNDISRLPPEFSRAERFDGVFFLDLPARQQREAIWHLYIGQFGLDPSQPRPGDTDWTGAEIKSCCRLAALLGVPLVEASLNVVPVAVTAAESVANLRRWASGRCFSADQPGIYQAQGHSPRSRRRLNVDPSNN